MSANPSPMQTAIVSEAQHGARLEQAVAALFSLSRKEARLAIVRGQVRLGRRQCKILSRSVRDGQRLTLLQYAPGDSDDDLDAAAGASAFAHAHSPAGRFAVRAPAHLSLPILYACRHLIAVDKPSGLLSERDRFGAPSVESVLAAQLVRAEQADALWLVHRLDAGTSGVLLLARSAVAARALFAAFRQRDISKSYQAIGKGDLAQPLRCRAALGRVRGTQQGVMASDAPGAKEASTQFRPLARSGQHTWVEALPRTGRTHQIRVHLAHLGHPIVGDALYGGERVVAGPGGSGRFDGGSGGDSDSDGGGHGQSPGQRICISVGRPMLHAARLRFAHPVSGDPIEVAAPLPDDFSSLLMALGLAGRVHRAACKPLPAEKKRPSP